LKKPARIILIALLPFIGVATWQVTRPPDVRLTFLHYLETNDGRRCALLKLENLSSETIDYYGLDGRPFTKFQTVSPSSVKVESNGGHGCVIERYNLHPGQRAEFPIYLQAYLNSNSTQSSPIEAPFRIGMHFSTAKGRREAQMFNKLRIPSKWRPPVGKLIWTKTIVQ
jgi:hypothetical protein